MIVDLHREEGVLAPHLRRFLDLEGQQALQEVRHSGGDIGVIGRRECGREEPEPCLDFSGRYHDIGWKKELNRKRAGNAEVEHFVPFITRIVGSNRELKIAR